MHEDEGRIDAAQRGARRGRRFGIGSAPRLR